METQSCELTSQIRRAPIPKTRDPFINALMMRLSARDDGVEQFWISTWNSLSGALGVVVSEHGDCRVYRTTKRHGGGFYSAAPAGPGDPNGLWLLGWLHQAVHLDLQGGEFTTYDTGAVQAITFSGMPLDQETGKLLAVAFAPPKTLAVTFDAKLRKAGRVQEVATRNHYMRQSFPNGDGTWSILLQMPGESLLVWDPQTDALEEVVISEQWHSEQKGTTYQFLRDGEGRVYFPHRGWYDPRTRTLTNGPRPNDEMTWFGNLGDCAVGINMDGATATLGLWDFSSGEVRPVATIPDCHVQSVALTASQKVVAVNLYGDFYRIDARTGSLECSRRLPTDAIGAVDCICRLDKHRVLGTPYITQRFWETNFATKEGTDCGRVAPGFGEITRLQKVGTKVFLAAYNGGQLMEYDPDATARYPENPRVVAAPPGALRPVGICSDGRHVFYSCSRKYGTLGSTLTRYDTRTGRATDVIDPIPNQQIHSLVFDKQNARLIAGTTFHADCQSCPPKTETCYIAAIDAATLEVATLWPAPPRTVYAFVLGVVGKGSWLLRCQGQLAGGLKDVTLIAELHEGVDLSEARLRSLPAGTIEVQSIGRGGRYLLRFEKRIELWDMNRSRRLEIMYSGRQQIQQMAVDNGSLIVVLPREVLVHENCLGAETLRGYKA